MMPNQDLTTILLVDDEPNVLDTLEKMLTLLGYRVLKAMDVVEALDVCKRHQAEIDLVLIDQIMLNITGLMVSKRLHKLYPTIKIVLMSGLNIEAIQREKDHLDFIGYLQKPFTIAELQHALDANLAPSVDYPQVHQVG
ncbi:MAG: response regulator [Chloroflexota bacterium]